MVRVEACCLGSVDRRDFVIATSCLKLGCVRGKVQMKRYIGCRTQVKTLNVIV